MKKKRNTPHFNTYTKLTNIHTYSLTANFVQFLVFVF